jgi:hypothetical protein
VTRRDLAPALASGALAAGLFVAVGAFQAYLVAHDWLHGQPGFLALQLTWIVDIPAGLLLLRLGRHLAARARGVGAIARAEALAGLMGSSGCVLANAVLQMTRREHPLQSYQGVMPAFVPESILAVLLAGALVGVALGLGSTLLGSWRAEPVRVTMA